MDLQLLEHRVRVTSIDKSGLWFYTHPIVKLLFLRHRTRCKFFSLTETPEDYTLMLDEEGFTELPQSDFLHVAEHTWRVLNVLSNGFHTGGVTKITKSVIAPLAEQNVSVLMLSTYQTDYILVREDDLPLVIKTLLEELTIYKEENGELVRMSLSDVSDCLKVKSLFTVRVHPVQSPANRFCILTLDRDTLPSISTILLDVLFYSRESHEETAAQNSQSFSFFAFSLIDGYISIVMDAEIQKKFPTDLLLTSSSGELWRMVRIGGQPLGFVKSMNSSRRSCLNDPDSFCYFCDECGIVAQIAGTLATADISAYYISTFNFDHALVPEDVIDTVITFLLEREENKSECIAPVLLQQ